MQVVKFVVFAGMCVVLSLFRDMIKMKNLKINLLSVPSFNI